MAGSTPQGLSQSMSQHHASPIQTQPMFASPQRQQQMTQITPGSANAPGKTPAAAVSTPLAAFTNPQRTVTTAVAASPGSNAVPGTVLPLDPHRPAHQIPPPPVAASQNVTHTVNTAIATAPAVNRPAVNSPTQQPPPTKIPWGRLNPFAEPVPADRRYDHFVIDDLEDYPRGYPSVAAYIAGDTDGRVYRRFSYVRNRLLLWYQDQIISLEKKLNTLDDQDLADADGGDRAARERLICRQYDEASATSARKAILKDLEEILGKYDEVILRENEIMSIQNAPGTLHRALFDFVWNGKKDADGVVRKHLRDSDYAYLFRREDFMVLGRQDDAWLGTWSESVRKLLPVKLRDWLLASAKDRERSARAAHIRFYSDKRVSRFVKGVVCAANTVLLVVPIVILYAASLHQASGWVKIGILLVFVVIFAFMLAALTNASRSDMFAACAGYSAVLIVFLTYSGP